MVFGEFVGVKSGELEFVVRVLKNELRSVRCKSTLSFYREFIPVVFWASFFISADFRGLACFLNVRKEVIFPRTHFYANSNRIECSKMLNGVLVP